MVVIPDIDPVQLWPQPDTAVLRHGRRPPPAFPLEVLGPFWADWVTAAAAGASAPVDYTAATLLAAASTLIGHARWVSPWKSWSEPPVLWIGNIGDPSSGKSPAADPIITVLRSIEIDLAKDFPAARAQWMKEAASAKAHRDIWESGVKTAAKDGKPPPEMPAAAMEPTEPVRARIVSNDATTEKLAELAAAHRKGLMLVRDELSGWYGALGRYSKGGADRAFWVEAYGGRPYAVDRVKNGMPVIIDRLAIALFGSIQPDRLAEMLASPDDGLAARFLWSWPDKIPARRPIWGADLDRAAEALRLLYDLPLVEDDREARPYFCRLSDPAADTFALWWTSHQSVDMTGPLAGQLGKAPGHVVRLALVLEHLWWCAGSAPAMPPSCISVNAVTAAIALVVDYFNPMAARAYGDAAVPEVDRLACIVGRWIIDNKPTIINARKLRREAGLPGLREAEKVKLALGALVEADWLAPAPERAGGGPGRKRDDYLVNPRLRSPKNG